jgi:hypothetical protein
MYIRLFVVYDPISPIPVKRTFDRIAASIQIPREMADKRRWRVVCSDPDVAPDRIDLSLASTNRVHIDPIDPESLALYAFDVNVARSDVDRCRSRRLRDRQASAAILAQQNWEEVT